MSCLNRDAKAFAPSHTNSGMHLPGGKQNIDIASQGEQEQEKHSAAQFTKRVLGGTMSVSKVLPVATHCLKSLSSHPMTAHGCWQGPEQSGQLCASRKSGLEGTRWEAQTIFK